MNNENTYNDYYYLERTKSKKAKAKKRLDYYNIVKSYFNSQSVTQADIECRRKAVRGWGIVTTDYER